MKRLEEDIVKLNSERKQQVSRLQTLLEIQDEFDINVHDSRWDEIQDKITSLIFDIKFLSREIDYKRIELHCQKLYGDE